MSRTAEEAREKIIEKLADIRWRAMYLKEEG